MNVDPTRLRASAYDHTQAPVASTPKESLVRRYLDGSVCVYEGPLRFPKVLACMALQERDALVVPRRAI